MGIESGFGDVRVPWPEWRAVRVLGSGSYGKVYEIQKREDDGRIQRAALKVMKIPTDDGEVFSLRASGLSDREIDDYFYKEASRLKNEIILMEELQTAANIVSIKNSKIIRQGEGRGCQLFIMMELLTSLDNYCYGSGRERAMNVEEVIKVGTDICDALSACEKRNIIHRDIKPSNIFVSEYDDFKLGDFGVSRQKEHTYTNMSQQGTLSYMAPEIYKDGRYYDGTVDIYSLGLVLYRLLNWGRFPFVQPKGEAPTYEENTQAHIKRMNGEILPDPALGGKQLGDILRKACSFLPKDRYQKAEDMKKALLKCQFSMSPEELAKQIIRRGSDHTLEAEGRRRRPVVKELDTGNSYSNPPRTAQTVPPREIKMPGSSQPFNIPTGTMPSYAVKKTSKFSFHSFKAKAAVLAAVAAVMIIGLVIVLVNNGKTESSDRQSVSHTVEYYLQNYETESMGKGTAVFGNSEISKNDIIRVEFLNTLSEVPDHAWDVSTGQTDTVKAWVTGNAGAYELFVAENGGVKVRDCRYLFANYNNVEEIILNNLNTENAVRFDGMFVNCRNLKILESAGIDTSSAVSTYFMFGNCESLTELDVSTLSTEKITNFDGMFSGCKSLTELNVSGFQTDSAKAMNYMFQDCSSLTELDLSSFQTQNVKEFMSMFNNCTSLELLNLSSFDVSQAATAEAMFQNCSSLVEVIGIEFLDFPESADTDNIYKGSSME